MQAAPAGAPFSFPHPFPSMPFGRHHLIVRIVLQRVRNASVSVEGQTVGAIGRGLLLLVGVAQGDSEAEARRLAEKCAELRIFPGPDGRFDLSLVDVRAEALVVSQFTLLAETRRGRRPSFAGAAPPEMAEPLVETFAQGLRDAGVPVQTGRFGAKMDVALLNDGPVTIVIDSADLERSRRR